MSEAQEIRVEELRSSFVADGMLAGIEHHETIDSTNLRAAKLGREGVAAPTLVLAEHQSAGRGRQGRSWDSPPRRNFYGSFLLRPKVAPADVPPMTLVAAIAVAEAIEALEVPGAGIKWPNDIVLGGKKAAGILTEMETDPEGVAFVVVGIGVNLNLREDEVSPELRGKATSLRMVSGSSLDRTRFVAELVQTLAARLEVFDRAGFAALRDDYESRHVLDGEEVEVQGGSTLRGRVVGVDERGALLLRTQEGIEAVHAGEVSLSQMYKGG